VVSAAAWRVAIVRWTAAVGAWGAEAVLKSSSEPNAPQSMTFFIDMWIWMLRLSTVNPRVIGARKSAECLQTLEVTS
jgi:hypothetical protein